MKTNSKFKMLIISVVAAIVVVSIIAGVVLGGNPNITNNSYGYGKKSFEFFAADYDLALGTENEKLLINSKNATAVFSYKDEVVFNAFSSSAADNSLASLFNVRLRDENGNIYTMDSYKNGVESGTYDIKKDGDKISCEFRMFPDKTVFSQGSESADFFMDIKLDFAYENSNFTVSVDTNEITLPKGIFVETISILPGVFSASAGELGSYYTVPDGNGAEIDLSYVGNENINLKLPVYGSDTCYFEESKGANLPYFAYTKNGVLLNTIINDADAISEITCKKSSIGGGYLYNTFTVTPCTLEDKKFTIGDSYEGVISQVYILSKTEKSYNEIASQVRDNLILNGYLNDKLNGIYNDYPVFLNLIGSPDGKNVLTSFEQAAEITAFLKSRGVRNISLRLSGFEKKGLNSLSENMGEFSSKSGSKQGYEDLLSLINEQGNTLWLDVNVATENSKNGKIKVNSYDDKFTLIGETGKDMSLADTDTINDNISAGYNLAAEYENADICLNDVSQFLYSDPQNNLTRQQFLNNLKDKICSLSASGRVMLSHPAVYLMKEADSVFSLPQTPSSATFAEVKAVPVLQMVLHGSVVYGGEPINISSYSKEDAVLKCIEYGAVPTFILTHKNEGVLDYSKFSSIAAQYYSDAKSMLPLIDMKMTSHEEVVSNVYKITYDYTKIVYVNYNPSAVEVDGIMISAKEFVII